MTGAGVHHDVYRVWREVRRVGSDGSALAPVYLGGRVRRRDTTPSTSDDTAEGNLLGIFPINAVHNVVHLVIGAALLYGATATPRAIAVAKVVGIVYLAVALLGFVAPDTFGLMPIGGADIFLHLFTAAVLLYIGFMYERSTSSNPTADRART